MKPIPSNIAVSIEPGFREAVAKSQPEGVPVMMSLEAFAGEPLHFYNHVWYANSYGADVMLLHQAPEPAPAPPPQGGTWPRHVQAIVLTADLLLIAGDGEQHTAQAGQTVFCTQAPDRPNRVLLRFWVDRGPKRFLAERGMDLLEVAPIILQRTL